MNNFSIVVLIFSSMVSALIMVGYYYSVFKEDKIKMYDSTWYTLFILHLIVLYFIVTVFNYLFIKLILNSPIYGIKKSTTRNNTISEKPFGISSIFNENTRNLFKKRAIPPPPPPIKYYYNSAQGPIRAAQNNPNIFWD